MTKIIEVVGARMTWGNTVKIQLRCKEYVNHKFGNNGRYNSLRRKKSMKKKSEKEIKKKFAETLLKMAKKDGGKLVKVKIK